MHETVLVLGAARLAQPALGSEPVCKLPGGWTSILGKRASVAGTLHTGRQRALTGRWRAWVEMPGSVDALRGEASQIRGALQNGRAWRWRGGSHAGGVKGGEPGATSASVRRRRAFAVRRLARRSAHGRLLGGGTLVGISTRVRWARRQSDCSPGLPGAGPDQGCPSQVGFASEQGRRTPGELWSEAVSEWTGSTVGLAVRPC